MKLLYGLCIGLSAFLLFSVEPMSARDVLPIVGGSSSVWITALAFFQLTLLLGYGYAVAVARASAERRGLIVLHLGLTVLALASLLPGGPGGFRDSLHHPQEALFFGLFKLVGVPFVVLSTTSPLLQAWYARREGRPTPYRLFALSNLSSLLALLAYPLVVEPYLRLSREFLLWKVAFVIYALLMVLLTVRMRSASGVAKRDPVPWTEIDGSLRSQSRRRWLWFALPAVASFQLAAISAHLTQDVAALPLLWVVPLAAYLLSFVLAFELPRLYHRAFTLRLLTVLLFALGYSLAQTAFTVPIGIGIVLFTAELFLASWFCHAEFYALRPGSAAASTHFYLSMAAGGAAGTLAVAVLSPLLTDSNYDLPFGFMLTAALILLVVWQEGWAQRVLWFAGSALAVYLLVAVHAAYGHDALFRARNFYGSLRVKQTQTPPQAMLSRTLYNGHIEHGMQWFSSDSHRTPLTYYAPDSGVGLALDHCCGESRPRRIGVIGLGAGTLAAYGRAGDQIRFYEINPLVIDIAQHLFTYTRDTPASVVTVPGDARLSLAAEESQKFDVLVVDAFSGDSIPTHLLTREALTLYRRHLVAGGVLAFHTSNQYLDLAPVLARLAEGTPLLAREVDSAGEESRGESLASWVLLTDRAGFFDQPAFGRARPIDTLPDVRLWTDGYSSLLPVLHWTGRRVAVP